MQRQLLQISDRIPDDILLTLLKCFAQILSSEPESKVCGPFIRAFAKIRDDGVEKQFQAIIEEDEDQLKNNNNSVENECTFNYKIGNVVTQEVVYSMNNDGIDSREEDEENNVYSYNMNMNEERNLYESGQSSNHDHHDMPPLLESHEEVTIEENNEGVEIIETKSKENSEDIEDITNIKDHSSEEYSQNKEVNETSLEKQEVIFENLQQCIDDSQESLKNNFDILENQKSFLENPDQLNDDSQECLKNKFYEPEKPEIKDSCEEKETPKQEQRIVEQPVKPMQTVTLDDIQREIHEMQMFLLNKGIVPEAQHKRKHHQHHKKLKKIEDSYKVDFCVNLKKKSNNEKQESKSKAIIAKYLNDDTQKPKERVTIFDPSVPNTPEDFLKEKSVTEKINKKKQKIKNLDVSWQKLCDSQKKVYKHSNFKPLKTETLNEKVIG